MKHNLENKAIDETNYEKGAALVAALLVLVLLMGFVAFAVSNSTTETIVTNNDISESKTYAASEASLENTTINFVDLFQTNITPSKEDIKTVELKVPPGFGDYLFKNEINKIKENSSVVLTGGKFGGLNAIRDSWEIKSHATDTRTTVKVQVRRSFFSDRIPIFQFGAFFDNDLELNRPQFFKFGGRVHTNGNLWITESSKYGIYLNSKVTASGEIVNDIWKTGTTLADEEEDEGKVFVSDASGNPQELLTGEASVKCVGATGTNVFANNPNLPYCSKNPLWDEQKTKFQGNLKSNVSPLSLPLTKANIDLTELIKRGKNVGDMHKLGNMFVAVDNSTQDPANLSKERFANKPGIRISLSDSQNKLPGCAVVAEGKTCGVRLDGAFGDSIGYQPLPMTDGYKTTPLNATRMAINGRQIWIKVEMVSFDVSSNAPKTSDITQDILSLGVTEQAPIGIDLQIYDYNLTTDSRSIVKLQRFSIEGPNIPDSSAISYTSNYTINGKSQNLIVRYKDVDTNPKSGCPTDTTIPSCTPVDDFASPFPNPSASLSASFTNENKAHLKWADIQGSGYKYAIVPFPIQMYDAREGRPNDSVSEATKTFGTSNVPAAGVMSLVDIDISNLRKFLMGDFDGAFPVNTPYSVTKGSSLRSTDIPQENGWVVYVSDRRGDYDFDGEYDMEDIFPDRILQFNEDMNKNGLLDIEFTNEAAQYSISVPKGQAATADHLYYRRGVRLINGSVLPGKYNSTAPKDTKGFTFASENGIYVKGNYNATGVGVSTTSATTPAENYLPNNASTHIPASISGDAVTILSNNWKDANSFVNPFSAAKRSASDTVVRFAMISGINITGSNSITYSPSSFGQKGSDLISFKRLLENWTGKRLNYSGSLINLFNSRNNTGFFKCCNMVFVPPTRDWVFDKTFLDINRIPPGTPNIYSITFTGFERISD